MASDFTVVFSVRQRFGEIEPEEVVVENAPHVGSMKEYEFGCPDVDGSQKAALLFQSQGLGNPDGLQINGIHIPGGIPDSYDATTITDLYPQNQSSFLFFKGMWHGNIMIVPKNLLRENNTLRISSGDAESFIIDNVVVLFKTRPRSTLTTNNT